MSEQEKDQIRKAIIDLRNAVGWINNIYRYIDINNPLYNSMPNNWSGRIAMDQSIENLEKILRDNE